MKKIALLLALVLLLSAFAVACGGSKTESPKDESSNVVSDNSNDSSDTSEEEYFAYTGEQIRENPENTVISVGAPYTKDFEAGSEYPDTYGMELTDGIRSAVTDGHYEDEALSGYKDSIDVIIDLGKTYDKIYAFEAGYLSFNEAGIAEPSTIKVDASNDGQFWTTIDYLVKPESKLGCVVTARLDALGYIKARYIRFRVGLGSAWQHLDELSVIADIEGGQKTQEYIDAVNNAYNTLGCVNKPASDVEINRELDKVLVSEGAKYTVEGTFKKFMDSGSMLTDGKTSGYYEGKTWVGFDPTVDNVVTINLGKNVKDIACIEANMYVNTNINTFLPVAVKVAALDKDKNRTELGILYGNGVLVNGEYCFSLPLDKAISARYIEVTFLATPANLIMVEEIGVYAYREETSKTLYPEVVIEEGASNWGSESSNEYENILKGNTTQQVILFDDIPTELFGNNSKVNVKVLTDGRKSVNTNIHNGNYFKFNQGGGRTVFFDLQHTSAIDKITAGFVCKEEEAVKTPNQVLAYASPDGKSWYKLGEIVLASEGENPKNSVHRGELQLADAVNVRYVAVSFDVGAWVGCDEIEVFGKKNSSGKSIDKCGYYKDNGFFSTSRIEPSDDILDGTKDLCLMYQSQKDFYTVEEIIPYIAYVDKDGKPVDLMFDNLLFLYNNTKMPSGGSPHNGSVMSDWVWTHDDLFAADRNVAAFETAAGQVKEALGLPADYKFKYTVTLYYPYKYNDSGATVAYDFGDVDGDGVAENTGKLEDRTKIMQWYIDMIENTVAEKNYQNIELVGYYWWHEALEDGDADSTALLNAISDMVHETDKEFFWIPYYCSNGYNRWADCGFDVACMQPNYVFDLEASYSKILTCAQLTKKFGMGFEMEIDGPALSNIMYYSKYMEYLGSGATLGYMNDTINMYYQSVTVFLDAARSENIMARNVYDQTYHYIKGDLNYNPAAIEGLNYTDAAKNTPYVGTIEFDNALPRMYQITVMPDQGTVTMNGDGTFTFYPAKDFTGEAKFTFVYSEYLGWSDPCEVTITVK